MRKKFDLGRFSRDAMRRFAALSLLVTLLFCIMPPAIAQSPTDPQLEINCETSDSRYRVNPESYPSGYATVRCIIFNPNDFRVSVEIDWDWELIVEVYNYEKGDNVEIGGKSELMITLKLNAEKYETPQDHILDFHGTITHYFQEGTVACNNCEKETASISIEIRPWSDFQINILDNDLPGYAQGEILDVCNEDILSGTYSLSVSIDYDSNIENIKFLAEFYARGRALDENGSYLPVDEFHSVERDVETVQNSNNGNFTMELQLEMTEQFQTTPSLDLYVYLEITVMNGDRHAEYDRIACSEEFFGLDETSLQSDFLEENQTNTVPAPSLLTTLTIMLIAFIVRKN